MRLPNLWNLFLISSFSVLLVVSSVSSDKLVVVMLDGFRWDLAGGRMTVEEIPNLKRFYTEGTTAEYVQPVFPSVNFPSWTTIATGLYPESHGIVGNYMYDAASGSEFNIDQIEEGEEDVTDDPMWWGKHVPLWTTATEQGLRTSLYLWSRCDVPFPSSDGNLILPEKCVPYNHTASIDKDLFETNLQHSLDDLVNGFDLVLLHYGLVEEIVEEYGPDGPDLEVPLRELKEADAALGRFLEALEESGMAGETNLVLVSGYGVTPTVDKNPSAIFSDVLDSVAKVVDFGPFSFVSVSDPSLIDSVVDALRTDWPGFHVYRREEIPEHYHVRGDERVLDILVVTRGTGMIRAANNDKYLPRGGLTFPPYLGMRGWDDTSPIPDAYAAGDFPDMRGIFFARGPAFRRGHAHQWIKLVDEYQVFTHLLGIEGRPHNGTWERVEGMLAGSGGGAMGALTSTFTLVVTLALTLCKV